MRILIFNCDFDLSPDTNGAQLLRKHLSNLGVKEIITKNAFENQIPGENEIKLYDRVVITGSRASVYEDLEWIKNIGPFIVALDKLRTPTLGICFGFQLVAEYLGGRVVGGAFEEGYRTVTLTENGIKSPLFSGFPEEFKVYQSHGDVARTLPADSAVMARDENSLQAYSLRNFFCVQFHPEILPETAKKMAVRDGKNIDRIINSVPEDYNLTLRILSNFIGTWP